MSGYKGETDGLKCKKEGNKGRLKSHNLGHCARLAEPYTSETTDLPPPAQIYDLLRSIRLFFFFTAPTAAETVRVHLSVSPSSHH